jgi:hypothetical protein
MYVNAAHVREFISKDQARLSNVQYSNDFGRFLNSSMPWNIAGTALSWDSIPNLRLNLSDFPEGVPREVIARSDIARHEFALVMFNPDELGLICHLDFALEKIDKLYWLAPANRYMCGGDYVDGEFVPAFGDLGEYSGTQYLTFTAGGSITSHSE